jgi:hypothetical protein
MNDWRLIALPAVALAYYFFFFVRDEGQEN